MNTELKVIGKTLPIININFDEVEQELQGLLASYKGLVFTEETEKDGKEVQKKLAKLSKDIDRRRIDIKKEVSEPIAAFEARCNKLTAMVDEVNAPIKQGLQVFEIKRKEDKADQIRKYIHIKIANNGLLPEYAKLLVVDEKYLNVTTTMKSIKEDIDAKAETLRNSQVETERAQETVAAHIQQMNDLLELAQPLKFEYSGWEITSSNLPGILADITKKGKERKASEEAAVERQKAKEAEAEERAKAAEQLRQEAAAKIADAFNVPPDELEKVDPEGKMFDTFVKMNSTDPRLHAQPAAQGPTGLSNHTAIADEFHAQQP
jgi:hypothetical protein